MNSETLIRLSENYINVEEGTLLACDHNLVLRYIAPDFPGAAKLQIAGLKAERDALREQLVARDATIADLNTRLAQFAKISTYLKTLEFSNGFAFSKDDPMGSRIEGGPSKPAHGPFNVPHRDPRRLGL